MRSPIISIDSIRIDARELDALVRVTAMGFLRTSMSPGLSQRALRLLPGLVRHTCENDAGRSFTMELADTESAHLLEHVAVELMALAGSPRSLKAQTRWDFASDGRGCFHLVVAYDDDLVALGALKHAAEIVNWLLDPVGESPDIERIAGSLSAVRLRAKGGEPAGDHA